MKPTQNIRSKDFLTKMASKYNVPTAHASRGEAAARQDANHVQRDDESVVHSETSEHDESSSGDGLECEEAQLNLEFSGANKFSKDTLPSPTSKRLSA